MILVAVLSWLFRSTYLGLSLEAAGNKPAALDAAGVDVVRTRSRRGALHRAFSPGSAAPTWRMSVPGLFVPFMTGGAGFIGIVLAMLARGRPLWVLIGAAAVRRESCHDDGAAGRRHRYPHRRRADAALRHGDAGAGDLRPGSMLPPALGLPYMRGER